MGGAAVQRPLLPCSAAVAQCWVKMPGSPSDDQTERVDAALRNAVDRLNALFSRYYGAVDGHNRPRIRVGDSRK